MVYDLQKASMLKRISAYIFDMILIVILATGFFALLSSVLHYDSYSNSLLEYCDKYEAEYGTSFHIDEETYNSLPEVDMQKYKDAYAALIADEDAMYVYNMLINLTMIMLTAGILLSYAVLEFAVPLLLKNGQTVGKKIFGIAVMRTNGVKMSTLSLFIRTFLGKYTVETMIPVLIIMMILFNSIGVVGPAILFILLIAEIVLMVATRTNSALHDIMADTVTVDFSSQLIFDSEEDLLEYRKQAAAEKASRQEY
ncbi:MAG: RDD family protein [Oscillospiraceae bacterium]|nr:RDD family protein [Oscillospiraceae bacterium]